MQLEQDHGISLSESDVAQSKRFRYRESTDNCCELYWASCMMFTSLSVASETVRCERTHAVAFFTVISRCSPYLLDESYLPLACAVVHVFATIQLTSDLLGKHRVF
jgi:hypothetical protein